VASVNIDDNFWDERDELKHIRQFARSRRANPLSVLAVALVRATCQIPPNIVLPPTIGGRVAPNLFCALVGESGFGKGASERAGRDTIRFVTEDAEDLPEFSPGSGEGLARTLMTESTALFVVSEVDTLGSLFARRGQTLEPELRKLFMGEHLGFANAGKETRTKVDALSYRAGLIVGVQPLRAGVLLNGADGGTPQRFLWAPTRDPDMPDDKPDEMEPLDLYPCFHRGEVRDLVVPGVAVEEMDRQQVDTHRGEPGIDPLDGHALLTRLKVAAGLMVLADRSYITEDDWELARRVTLLSKWTRADVQRAVEEQSRRRRIARAAETAEHDEYLEDRKLRRTRNAIVSTLDKLRDGEWIGGAGLRRKLRKELRGYLGEAIAQLIDEGPIEEAERNGGHVYRRVHPVHSVHRSLNSEDTGVRQGVRSTPHKPTPQPPTRENTPTESEPASEPDNSAQTPQPPSSKHNGAKLSPDCTNCGRYPTAGNPSFQGICAACITRERSRR
jgi:hypothetical protein